MFYVTCGRWVDDANLVARISAEIRDLEGYNIFSLVEFTPVDASTLQRYFRETRSHSSASIIFQYHVALPEIHGVREAYIGILPGPEYLNLIVDESGNIKKSLFYDNVRDFQGSNAVNQKIDETIASGSLDQFAIRNNGVTIVARALTRIGNRFNVEDYQVVNGCQTSHVLYNRSKAIDGRLMVPVKLVVTEDDTITNAIIESTNSQTEVRLEELEALSAFQKKLEDFFNTFDGDARLHYERRSRQYSNMPGIEKVRIVAIGYQIRYFAAMFLNEPHRAGRYYGTLLKLIGGRVFGHNHHPDPYYTAAYAAYRLEFLFRNGMLDSTCRIFKYHILMTARILMQPGPPPAFHSRRIVEYCGAMNERLWNVARSQEVFAEAIGRVQAALDATGMEFSRDTAKTQAFRDAVLATLGNEEEGGLGAAAGEYP